MELRLPAAIILKELNPRLFLIMGVWVLLNGLGLLIVAAVAFISLLIAKAVAKFRE